MYANWFTPKRQSRKHKECKDGQTAPSITRSPSLWAFNVNDLGDDKFRDLTVHRIGGIQLYYPDSCFENSQTAVECVMIIDSKGTIWYYFENKYKHYCGDSWSIMGNGWSTVLDDAIVIKSLTFGDIICEHPFHDMGCDPFHPIIEFDKSPMPADLLKNIIPNISGLCNRTSSFEYITSKFGPNIALHWRSLIKRNIPLTQIPVKNYEPFALICDSLFDLLCNFITGQSNKNDDTSLSPLAPLRLVCSSFNNMIRPNMYHSFKFRMRKMGRVAQVPHYGGTNYICSLHEEIIRIIFSFLSVRDIIMVCKSFRALALSPGTTFICSKSRCLVQLKSCTIDGITKLHQSKCNCIFELKDNQDDHQQYGQYWHQTRDLSYNGHHYDYDDPRVDYYDELGSSSKYDYIDRGSDYDQDYIDYDQDNDQDYIDYDQDYDHYYDDD